MKRARGGREPAPRDAPHVSSTRAPFPPRAGLFNDLSQDLFINVLQQTPLHSRLLLTTFVNKSFRMLRSEPELFSHITFRHVDSTDLAKQYERSRWNSVCCPAAHFANILAGKGPVVTSLEFGSDTPLTAIKSCIKTAGPQVCGDVCGAAQSPARPLHPPHPPSHVG